MTIIKKNIILQLLVLLTSAGYAQNGIDTLIAQKGQLIYANALSSHKDVNDWVMEGPGVLQFKNGWMEMYSPGQKWDHVFWCKKTFPSDFIAQWYTQDLRPQEGLTIVFFAATGNKGQSIFDASMPKRDGTFKYYNKGEINCYHISYYANNPKHPDRGDSHLRKDPMFAMLQSGREGIPTNSLKQYHITLIKNEGHILMYVDNNKIIDYTDDGKKFGNIYGKGNIGFRQMRWSDFRYKNFKVWEIKK